MQELLKESIERIRKGNIEMADSLDELETMMMMGWSKLSERQIRHIKVMLTNIELNPENEPLQEKMRSDLEDELMGIPDKIEGKLLRKTTQRLVENELRRIADELRPRTHQEKLDILKKISDAKEKNRQWLEKQERERKLKEGDQDTLVE